MIAYTAKYRHKHGSPPTVPIATTTTHYYYYYCICFLVISKGSLSLCFASCFHKISITYMREWLTRPRILHFIHINVFLFYFILGLVCIDTKLKRDSAVDIDGVLWNAAGGIRLHLSTSTRKHQSQPTAAKRSQETTPKRGYRVMTFLNPKQQKQKQIPPPFKLAAFFSYFLFFKISPWFVLLDSFEKQHVFICAKKSLGSQKQSEILLKKSWRIGK